MNVLVSVMVPLGQIDHVAYPVRDLAAMIGYLERVLGARRDREPFRIDGEIAVQQLVVGCAVLSLHRADNGMALAAPAARPGVLDICFRWNGTAAEALAHLERQGIEVIEGPVPRRDAGGEPGRSVYFRDPDGNLIELMARS